MKQVFGQQKVDHGVTKNDINRKQYKHFNDRILKKGIEPDIAGAHSKAVDNNEVRYPYKPEYKVPHQATLCII